MTGCTLGLESSELEIKMWDCCSRRVSVSVSRVSLAEQLFSVLFYQRSGNILSPGAAAAMHLQPCALQASVGLHGPGLRLVLALAFSFTLLLLRREQKEPEAM